MSFEIDEGQLGFEILEAAKCNPETIAIFYKGAKALLGKTVVGSELDELANCIFEATRVALECSLDDPTRRTQAQIRSELSELLA